MPVSKEERADWLSWPSADALREQLAADVQAGRDELLSRGLKSIDPNVRAAAERVQTTCELLGKLTV